ncbi:MAG TPA: PadR family transcriptional regulator [Gemmatimonadaceae bacterium]|nr:PadR family transcriptional regulator [Gemmatimonadaceae bacterium]
MPRGTAMDELDVSLTRGTLDLLILKALSWGPRHGYAVVEWIETATGHAMLIGEGTLYPALHRLERGGFVGAEWGLSENNRHAKFYRLSTTGRRRLRSGTSSWQAFVDAAGRALRAPTAESV